MAEIHTRQDVHIKVITTKRQANKICVKVSKYSVILIIKSASFTWICMELRGGRVHEYSFSIHMNITDEFVDVHVVPFIGEGQTLKDISRT